MKILILGSNGFIGSHCVDYFISKKYDVYGIDITDADHRNYYYKKILPDSKEFDNIFSQIKPDACLFAIGSASVAASIQEPLANFESNTLQTIRILQAIKKYSPTCKFINISSAAVYGNPDTMPIKESSTIQPVSPYGWHKYYSELICKEYYLLYNINTCSIRPFSVYGPRQNKLLFWDFYLKSQKGDKVELFGTGKETRDFIYISDLVIAIDIILNNAPMKAETYNLATGRELSIKEVAAIFAKTIEYNGQINFNNISKLGDPIKWVADIESLKQLGFKPTINIETGLQFYAKWLKENE